MEKALAILIELSASPAAEWVSPNIQAPGVSGAPEGSLTQKNFWNTVQKQLRPEILSLPIRVPPLLAPLRLSFRSTRR